MNFISDENIELYSSLFRGRTDAFARFWEKNGRSGYSPAYSFSWNEYFAHKQKGGSMKTFENKKIIPLTKEILRQHLLGQSALGLYPILEDNTSYFLVADFDGEHWLEDAQRYIGECAKAGLSAYWVSLRALARPPPNLSDPFIKTFAGGPVTVPVNVPAPLAILGMI